MPLIKPLQVLHTFALVPISFPQFGQDAISAPNFDYLLRPKYFLQVFRQSQIRLGPVRFVLLQSRAMARGRMIICDVKGQEDFDELKAKLDKYYGNQVRLLKK